MEIKPAQHALRDVVVRDEHRAQWALREGIRILIEMYMISNTSGLSLVEKDKRSHMQFAYD